MKKNDIIKIVIIVVLTVILGVLVKLTVDAINDNNSNQMQGGMPNQMQSADIEYSGVTEITDSISITQGDYSSENADENALLINGDIDVKASDITVAKTGDSDGGDNTSFYGINSAIIAKSGARLTLSGINVTTDAVGGNGVFCYGGSATTNNSSSDGTTVTISDSTITTKKDNSGGIMTTGGGTMYANNLTVNTAGISSAAIRTDRGGGTVVVDGGSYTTTGQGSPAVYSTADVTVKNSTLTATTSEGIVVEGKNSVSLENCDLTDSNTKLNGMSTTYKNIFLYQSMSGDAATGQAVFTSKNSNIVTNNGDTFYVTNTTAEINLTNNTITNNDKSGNFIRIQKDSWGNEGSNGGTVTLNMTKQKAIGNIVVDSISTLEMNMQESSYFEGAINTDNSAKEITLKISSDSKIKLTGDCYVTSLDNEDSTNSNIELNGYKLYVNGKEI